MGASNIYRFFFLFIFIFYLNLFVAEAQTYYQPTITAGTVGGDAGIPTYPTATNTVIFKGETKIVLQPNFDTKKYDSTHTGVSYAGTSYFRAYLVTPASYAELKTKLDGSFATTIENILYFKYIEKYAGGSVPAFKVYDYQRNVMTTTQTPPLAATVTGANFYQLDITQFTSIASKDLSKEENTFYTLEIVNAKGELFQLRFKYLKVL